MDGSKSGKRSRLTILSPSATQEAADPEAEHVREVEDRPGYMAIMVKWKKANYSHFVVFRRTDYGVEVVRILHSSRDIPSHLEMQ